MQKNAKGGAAGRFDGHQHGNDEKKDPFAPVLPDLFEAAELSGKGSTYMHALRAQPFARRDKAREIVSSDIALGKARQEASRQARMPKEEKANPK